VTLSEDRQLLSLHRPMETPTEQGTRPASTEGRVIYAIGDLHGRMDLLELLLDQISQDALVAPGASKPVLIFLGDYVDRGPASKAVVDRVIALTREAAFEVCALKGNHEQAVLEFLRDPPSGAAWCANGGAQTLTSYGVDPPIVAADHAAWNTARNDFIDVLPADHAAFFADLRLTAIYGDYVFVHAGLRPGVPLEAQSETDLLWIRQDFLNAPGLFEKVVVHGHTPVDQASMGVDRINIDTGAYATGVLTAIRLEGDTRRLIQVGASSPFDVADIPAQRSFQPRLTARASDGALGIATLILSVLILACVALLIHASGGFGGKARPNPVPHALAASPEVVSPRSPTAMKGLSSAPPGESEAVATPGPVGFAAEIGPFASATAASQTWQALIRGEPDILSNRVMAIETQVEKGATVYRGLIGGFASPADAARFCAAVDAAGHGCLVRRSG
jgi:serine/threonine protein phosphatase 1